MKKEYKGQCIFCGQPVSSNQAGTGYTKTRRKTIILFHEICFHKNNVFTAFDKDFNINKGRIEK